jgi:sugar O-acyltransferase (sialic acid O-acetyltransferase NeuD family)
MKKALIGNGGHSREVMCQMREDLVCFIDDEFLIKESDSLLPLSKLDPFEYELMISVGDSLQRRKLFEKLPKECKFFTFIHPSALILSNDVKIGSGCFIGAYSILTCNISIGDHSILNRHNQVGHDCEIDIFSSLMPGSVISGNCKIGKNFYLGSNSSVREKISICENVIVGMNSCVVKSIFYSGTYVGTPSKKIK